MREPALVIDCRMYLSSGIGVYLQNLLPRLSRTVPEDRMILLGDAAILESLSVCMPHAKLREVKCSIYSLAEQIEMPLRGFMRRALWWSPHFNIPLAHYGPLVVTIHDLFHLANLRVTREPLQFAYARAMFGAVRRRASKVLCVSQFTAAEFIRLLGRKQDQLEVIHNGIDLGWFEEVSLPRPQSNAYFLFVGNLKPHKNVGRLISAFADIAPQVPHDLVIVGQRSGFITGDPSAERAAERVGSRVKFAGAVDLSTLRQWYKYAEALVFPSLYEGFGFPPLEAMAIGCPAIVSNLASMPEVCGDAALYCDPNDVGSIAAAMLRLVQDQALRFKLVEEGLVQAKKYSWDAAGLRTGQVLRSFM